MEEVTGAMKVKREIITVALHFLDRVHLQIVNVAAFMTHSPATYILGIFWVINALPRHDIRGNLSRGRRLSA